MSRPDETLSGPVGAAPAIRFRNVWMQKHPTPSHRGSDFHWHPNDVPATVRVELSELLSRYRADRMSLWVINEDHVVWARAFTAVAPGDPRRYTGLAACVAQPEGEPWQHAMGEIFATMRLPPPTPYDPATAIAEHSLPLPPVPDTVTAPAPVASETLAGVVSATQIAQAVYLGGPTYSPDPYAPELPAYLGRLLTWLPTEERAHPRRGAFIDRDPQNEISASTNRGLINLLHYLTLAWCCPPSIRERSPDFPERAWQLVLELSANLNRSLPDLLGDLGRVAAAWDTTDDLRQFVLAQRVLTRAQVSACDQRAPRPLFADTIPDAGWLWNRIMHYWGRALLPARDEELDRLAALLAQRIAVDHLFHLDAPGRVGLPRRYLRRLVFESLLPQERRAEMTRALARYAPSLFTEPEVSLG
ncbi:hypothetical protein [Haliangium sp.]|uniref:hypothetical protein n=1 Tax=Haliangium sp. TaxID=2663208 RepID=UPI003D0EA622